MSNEIIGGIVTVLLAVTGVAIIASLVSNRAQTSQVLTAGGNAFSNILGTAVGPITGFTPTSSLGGVQPLTIN